MSDFSVKQTVISNFVFKFRNFHYHGNDGQSMVRFSDTVKLADFEKKTHLVQASGTYLLQMPSYS